MQTLSLYYVPIHELAQLFSINSFDPNTCKTFEDKIVFMKSLTLLLPMSYMPRTDFCLGTSIHDTKITMTPGPSAMEFGP